MWLPDNRNAFANANRPYHQYMFTDDLLSHTEPFFDKLNERQQYDDNMLLTLAGLSDKAGSMQTEMLRPLFARNAPAWADTMHGMGVIDMKRQDAALAPSTVPAIPGAAPMVPMVPRASQPFKVPNLFDSLQSPVLAPSREVSPTIQAAASGSASVAPPVKVSDLGAMGPLGDALAKIMGGDKTPSLLEQTINDPTPMFGRDYLRSLKKDQDLADKVDTDQALRGLGIEMHGIQAQSQIAAREAQLQAQADRLQQTLAFRGQQGDLNRANQRVIAGDIQGTRLQVAGKSKQPTALDVLSQLNTELSAAQKEVDRLGKAYGPRMAAKKADYNKAVAMRDQVQRNIEAVKKQSGLFIVP